MPIKERPATCPCCNEEITESFLAHNLSPTHVFNFYIWAYSHKRKALAKDKEGVCLEVTPINIDKIGLKLGYKRNRGKYNIELDLAELESIQSKLEFRCCLFNERKDDKMYLTAAKILDAFSWASCYDDKTSWMESKEFVPINPKGKYNGVVIKFKIENVVAGSFKIPFAVNLQTENGDRVVTISRTITINVVEKKNEIEPETEEEKQKSPFTDHQWDVNDVKIVPPFRRVPLMNNYPIPPQYARHFRHGFKEWKNMNGNDIAINDFLKSQMEPGFVTKDNYKGYFRNCLWLEEQINALMLNKYNMENVTMEVVGQEDLRLRVPGLAEKRPSLIQGDMIRIRLHDDHTGYEGYIKSVEDNHVIIRYVDPELVDTIYCTPDLEMDVAFQLGRLPYERAHEGIDRIAFKGSLISLFPDELHFLPYQQVHKIKDAEFSNKEIINNLEQKTAVEKILNCSSQLAPYIVFGPPGTGKTVTIVEAIVQILRRTNKRILVCAPANAACDMLASKLIPYCSKKQLIRVHSETRDRSTVTKELRAYSNMSASGDFMKIGSKDLNKYRIVVSTLILIGKFGGSGDYRPDVLVVDEAAQALETDICVALGVLNRNGQIVLAGDPKQLGPIVQSTTAQNYGLNTSLLERLMDTQKVYDNHENPNFITMLKKNFRSHPTILEIPNKLFYNSELEAVNEKPKQDPVASYSIYPSILSLHSSDKLNGFTKGQALEFCAVSAKEQREGRSPSYFNPAEANMVIQYIKTLVGMKLGTNMVIPADIGVITPYIRQVYKIKELLKRNNFKDVEVGSTESFQGREKRIIIISTVRAQHDLLKFDKKYALGFVKQEKRFNVAITRAISKLIVIGCPAVLSTDPKWKGYIDACKDLKTYHGAPFEERTEDKMSQIIERFASFPNFSASNS